MHTDPIDPDACLNELRAGGHLPADPHCVFLAGSLVRGWGNATSDLDVYVVAEDRWPGESVEVAPVNLSVPTVPINAFYVAGRRWDVEYWQTAQIDQLLQAVSWTEYDRGALRERNFTGYEVNVIERMSYGLAALGAEWLEATKKELHGSALPTHLVTQRMHMADIFVEDAVGQLQSHDYESAVLSARRAFGCAVDALMASCGEFGGDQKWRARRFRSVKQDVLTFQEYWQLETMASYQDKRAAAWVEEVLETCRRIATNMEL